MPQDAPSVAHAVEEFLRSGARDSRRDLEVRLELAARTARGGATLGASLSPEAGAMVLGWAELAAGDASLVMAPLLEAARDQLGPDAVRAAARARIRSGPLLDALRCLPHAGGLDWLDGDPGAAARLDLLIWEAGAAVMAIPELGAWLWSDAAAQSRLIYERLEGDLFARVLAARALEIAADGLPQGATATVARVTRAVQSLASHPEPLVWIPAVRALGRMAARASSIRLLLQRWVRSGRNSERRRSITALAAVPGAEGAWIDRHADSLITSRDPWKLAAVGAAVPYLVRERPLLWESLGEAILSAGRTEALWSTTTGMLALVRGQRPDRLSERFLRRARDLAAGAETSSITEAQLWQAIRRDTDFLDDIVPDTAFPDLLLDRAAGDAVRLRPRAVVRRAETLARSVATSFDDCLAKAASRGTPADRAHALLAVESSVRAAALALWRPIALAAHTDLGELDAELGRTRTAMRRSLADFLARKEHDFALRRGALRGLGNLIDAESGGDADDPRRARVAAEALAAVTDSQWARAADRQSRRRFRKPITDLLWRVADALGPGPGATSFGPLAAWWAMAVGGTELLDLVQPDDAEAHARIVATAGAVRDAGAAALSGGSIASWSAELLRAFVTLETSGSLLAYATEVACAALEAADDALAGGDPAELEHALEYLAEPIALLGALRADPVAALEGADRGLARVVPDRTLAQQTLSAAREPTADRTVDQRAAGPAARWAELAGPILGPIVARTVSAITARVTARAQSEARDQRIGPYLKLRRLGQGGQGDVWLVRREGSRRRFVLKHARSHLSKEELREIFEREAKLLEGIYEAKVATFTDYGWDGDIPYLVLSYFIGADLDRYARVRPLTLAELEPIIRDVCLGLRALHERGIVHRDLKPSNIFLRLHLPREADEQFDPVHRDPAIARVAEAVLIDLGVADLTRVDPDRVHAVGTLGFIAPEQATAAPEITTRADTYGLAATVYTAMTNHRFFQEKRNAAAHLLAHASQPPLDDPNVQAEVEKHQLPAALVDLLRQATDRDPAKRPGIDEFAELLQRATWTV